MITGFIMGLVTLFIRIFIIILPSWSVWPNEIKEGLSYFIATLKTFNFILPIDSIFSCLLFLLVFIGYLLMTKVILLIVNR
jgi:hypothetical protein